MNQLALDLNPRRLARNSDPTTSHEAASRVREFAAGHAARILECLRKQGPLTPEQIGALICMDAYSVRKRLPELEQAGLARPNGSTAPTLSGRHQRVCEAT